MTELAPFPNIEKDKLKTEGYSHMLKIGDGWGKWSNTDIQFNYVVKDIKAELQDTIYIVTANSEFESKINNCEFIYSNENGFVSLKYEFYNGDKLSINKKKN